MLALQPSCGSANPADRSVLPQQTFPPGVCYGCQALDPRTRKVLYRTDAGLQNVQCALTRRGGRAPNAGCLPKRANTGELYGQ